AGHGAARTRLPPPGNMLATLGCGSTSLHRWDTRRLLDAATHRASPWGMAMRPTRDNSRMMIGLGAMTLLLVWTSCAHAHVEHGQAAGFVAGFGHPWSGFDHVLAMIAVGIWGAQLGEPAIWLLPVTFPMVMAFGGFLVLIGVHLPGVECGIAASALLLGAMVYLEARPQLLWAAV